MVRMRASELVVLPAAFVSLSAADTVNKKSKSVMTCLAKYQSVFTLHFKMAIRRCSTLTAPAPVDTSIVSVDNVNHGIIC